MKYIWAGVLASVLGIFAFALLHMQQKAPDIQFHDLNGRTVSLQALRGKPILINFWATSCPGCIREMPDWVDIYRKYHNRGAVVVAVAMSYDRLDFIKTFVTKQHLPFVVAWDADGTVAKTLGDVKLTPTTVWVDRSGNWVDTTLGEISEGKITQWLDNQLR